MQTFRKEIRATKILKQVQEKLTDHLNNKKNPAMKYIDIIEATNKECFELTKT